MNIFQWTANFKLNVFTLTCTCVCWWWHHHKPMQNSNNIWTNFGQQTNTYMSSRFATFSTSTQFDISNVMLPSTQQNVKKNCHDRSWHQAILLNIVILLMVLLPPPQIPRFRVQVQFVHNSWVHTHLSKYSDAFFFIYSIVGLMINLLPST